MKFLKYGLVALLICLVLAVLAAYVFIGSYLSPMVKDMAEKKGTEALGAPVTIGALSITLFPKIGAVASSVSFSMPKTGLTGKVKYAQVALHGSWSQILKEQHVGLVQVAFEEPVITFEPPAAPEQKLPETKPEGPVIPAVVVPKDLALDFKVNNGLVSVKMPPPVETKPQATPAPGATSEPPQGPTSVRLEGLSFSLETKSVNSMEAAIKLAAKAAVDKSGTKLDFPLKLQTNLGAMSDVLVVKEASGEAFGIAFVASGQQNLASGSGSWKLTTTKTDLAALPIPPSFLPEGKWGGKIEVSVTAESKGKAAGWRAAGRVIASDLTGETKYVKEDLSAQGLLKAQADLSFRAGPKAATPGKDLEYDVAFDKVAFDADFSGLAIEKKTLMTKPKGVPLKVSVLGQGSLENARVQKFDLEFATLKLNAQGDLATIAGKTSNFKIAVERTPLAGWEAYFPPLQGSPLKGAVQVNAVIQGDLQKPDQLNVELKPLLLEQIEASGKWASADGAKKFQGLAKLNGSVNIVAVGQDLKAADLKLDADLTDVSLDVKDTLTKRAGVPTKLNLLAQQKGQAIEVKSSQLSIGSSRIGLAGRISNPQRPNLALKVTAPSLNLAELAQLLPSLASFGVTGQASATVDLNGTYDFKAGIEESPLKVRAEAKAKLPTYKIARETAKKPEAAKEPAIEKPPEPLLPPWPVAQTAYVKADVEVATLLYGDTEIKGIRSTAVIENGALTAGTDIASIFGGSVKVPKVQMNLKEAQPNIALDAKFTNIDLSKGAAFASKDWEKLVRGTATGTTSAVVPHPSRKDFVDKMKASGNMAVQNGYLSTADLDGLINKELAKVPALGKNNGLKTGGVAAAIDLQFNLKDKSIQIGKFSFLTPERNELQAKGSLGLDKSIDLEGTAYLANAAVGGSIYTANSDMSGRLVVPIRIKGSLTDPKASFAQETITMMLKKTADLEIKKASAQAEAKARSEAQKELNKVQQRVQEELKKKGIKGLEGVFGN